MDNPYNEPQSIFVLFKIVLNYHDLCFLKYVLSNLMAWFHLHLSFPPAVLSSINFSLKISL